MAPADFREVYRVGVAGLGTVGSAVVEDLVTRRESLRRRTGVEVQLQAVAEPDMPEGIEDLLAGVDRYEDASRLIREGKCDVLVELIGGVEPAGTVIREAIDAGLDVVTANKELLAKQGSDIFTRSEERGTRIRFEASVGGAIPVVRTLREGFVDTDITQIYGIINGTANYVLTRMDRDEIPFEQALERAQEKGFAEADPSYDVEGDDSAHKVALLASLAFGTEVPLEEIHCEGITHVQPEIMEDARKLGYSIKLLGIAKYRSDRLDVRVHPAMIPEESALAAVNNQYNAVMMQGDPIGSSMLSGQGAGGDPTATAVVADVMSLAARQPVERPPVYFADRDYKLVPMRDVETRYYLRLKAVDRPGVLSKITSILGDQSISIDSVLQRGRSRETKVPIVLTTHRAEEGNMQSAVEQIQNLDVVGPQPICLRIEDEFEQNEL